MTVYFIQAGETDLIKIGYAARSVERRRAALQAGNHLSLNIWRIIPGGREIEAWLHKRFEANRVDREWFMRDPAMLTIEPPAMLKTVFTNTQHPQWEFIELQAATLGVTGEAIKKWRQRGKVPHCWRLPLLERAAEKHQQLDVSIFDAPPQRQKVATS
jgi:hypothetical protein